MVTMFFNQESDSQDGAFVHAWCHAILNTAVDAIITINDHGIIETVNPATGRMFGYDSAELVGQNISLLMPEPHRSAHDDYLARYRETGERVIIGVGRRVSGRRRDGSEFPIHLAVSEFFVHGRRFFSGAIRDLSELEQVQQQLLQSERLVAIGQMVTGLAHESRNALQRAQGCLDMLSLDLAEQPEQLDFARRATAALKDLYRLYEEVRSYAAPIHLEMRQCDLATIWRKEWDNLSALRAGQAVMLEEDPSNGSAVCEVDVHRLEQVFRNVLENALHACGQSGTVVVRVSGTTLRSEPAVKVVIEDNGCGLTAAAARQIFEPFFTTKQRGTGLGMAITQRIIDAHSGSISAEPAPERGTRICIILPVTGVKRNAFRTTASAEPAH